MQILKENVRGKESLPPIQKMSASSDISNILVIPKEVEGKIRYLQNKFPSTEWSGVLFYTHTGNFSQGITITCKDIYPMDLGSSTYTDFFMSEDVAAYIAEHQEELWECDMGLCHSHHTMNSFFSATDISTLQSEGNDKNTFVSLIVNNEGTYSAAITRKAEVNVKTETIGSFSLWDNDNRTLYKTNTEENQEIIQYFMLDIQKESAASPYQDIDERFKEIEGKKKKDKRNIPTVPKTGNVFQGSLWKNEEPYLFDKVELSSTDDIQVDKEALHNTVTRMILASLVVNPNKIDLRKWVNSNMESAYSKAFGTADSQKFKEYADWIVQYSIDYFEDERLLSLYPPTTDEYLVIVAKALYIELIQYHSNPYLEELLNSVYSYLSVYEQ